MGVAIADCCKYRIVTGFAVGLVGIIFSIWLGICFVFFEDYANDPQYAPVYVINAFFTSFGSSFIMHYFFCGKNFVGILNSFKT